MVLEERLERGAMDKLEEEEEVMAVVMLAVVVVTLCGASSKGLHT